MEQGNIWDRHLDTSDALDEFINSSSNTLDNYTDDNPPIAIVSDEVSGSNLSSHNPKQFLEGILQNTVTVFEGNNQSYVSKRSIHGHEKVKRFICVDFSLKDLYYYSPLGGLITKTQCYLGPYGLEDGKVLVSVWQTGEHKPRTHFLIFN